MENINSSKEKDDNKKINPDLINNELNHKENDNNSDYEGIPILSQLEIEQGKISLEDYYKKYYPEYSIINFYNFTFIKMGKLITFSFDKNNNYIPKYSIGPHWYLTVVLLIIILSLSIFLNETILKEEGNVKKFVFFILIVFEYILVFKTALTHPKVVMNKNKTNEENGYCNICKVYYNEKNKVQHCNFCKVCVEKMDHHCVWVGKCVAKNNTFYFYGMIVNVCFIYAYIIICGIFMAINK